MREAAGNRWASTKQGLGDCTAEARRAQSKEFLIKNSPTSANLCVSVVRKPESSQYKEKRRT